MTANKSKWLPTALVIALIVLVVAAYAVRLHSDEDQTNSSASIDRASDPLTVKLAECRSVTSEQKDALAKCRKAWAEKRRQLLGQKPSSANSDGATPQDDSSLLVQPKDESRLPTGYPPIPKSRKE